MNQILYVQNKLNTKTLIIVLSILLVFCLLLLSTIFSIINLNNEKILAKVTVCNIDLSDLTKEEAKAKLENEFQASFLINNLNISVNGVTYTIPMSNLGITPDYDAMVDAAYNVGRNNNFFANNFNIQKTYLAGKNIEFLPIINDDVFDQVLKTLKTNINETATDDTYTITDTNIIITKGNDGMALNIEQLKTDILACFTENKFEPITAQISNKQSSKVNLDALYNEVTINPIDATTVTENSTLVFKNHVEGKTFDLANAKQLVLNSTEKTIQIPLIITKPSITTDMLLQNSFKDVLATYQTKYKESEKNRSINVKLAANKINGTILTTNQEFSFNNIVGERTVANGFKTATVYENNTAVPGIGGGICQVSSTLYNAVLYANLEIVERKNHQLSVSYVPLGRDATVAYGTTDFKFKNVRLTPIKIEAIANDGVLTITILGTKANDDVEVTIKTITNRTIKYSTTTINDATLEKGKQITTRNGSNGYSISTYLITSKNGNELSNKLISTSTYNPTNAIVKVGTKIASEVPPINPQPQPQPQPQNPPIEELEEDPYDPDLPPGWDVPENPGI